MLLHTHYASPPTAKKKEKRNSCVGHHTAMIRHFLRLFHVQVARDGTKGSERQRQRRVTYVQGQKKQTTRLGKSQPTQTNDNNQTNNNGNGSNSSNSTSAPSRRRQSLCTFPMLSRHKMLRISVAYSTSTLTECRLTHVRIPLKMFPTSTPCEEETTHGGGGGGCCTN